MLNNKFVKFFMAGAMVCQMCVVTSCSDETTGSATDPLKYTYDKDKDASVEPGNSFFDYCCGTWLKGHPTPADPNENIGGMFDALKVMKERERELKAEQPDIHNFYKLSDEMYDNSEASRTYINEKRGVLVKPKTKEEAYLMIGKMYMEGVNVLNISTELKRDKDTYLALLEPNPITSQKPTYTQMKKARENSEPTSRSANGSPACSLVAQGMGIDKSLVWQDANTDKRWQYVWERYSIDDLYRMMQEAWMYYEAFADEEGLAAYNALWPEEHQKTVQGMRNDARAELNYTTSYYLQQRFVPQSLKEKFLALTKEIQASLYKRIENVDWMSEPTKQNALDKLTNCGVYVAYPDTWHKDCIPALTDCKTLVEAVHRLKIANAQLFKKIIGTNDLFSHCLTLSMNSSNDGLTPMDLTLVNATYMPMYNSIVIYPAMLLTPIMPEEGYSEACFYAVMTTIGHEFTHGFDVSGAKFDKYGNPKNWWTVSDQMNFEDRSNNLVRCYSSQELDPERAPLKFGDGKRTLNENIADLGGFLAARDAYIAHIEKQGFNGEQRNEQIRKFYESFAHMWCMVYGETFFKMLLESDVHSHSRLRTNGVVMNTDMWYDLYKVNRNHKLYLEKERRTYIW